MRTLKRFFTAVLVAGCLVFHGYAQTGKSDFEISKNIDIFVTLYKQLHLNYVDELNSGQLMKTAIDAMLESLDPYTVYIPEAEIEDYRVMTTGQYGGIGSLIHKRGHWVYISEPYEGAPADKAGLKAGDKILEINNQSAKDKTIDEVSTALKGQPGTEITVLIQRDSTQKPVEMKITREEVKLANVPYSGMLKDGIGYISLSQFYENAAKDVREAFSKLRDSNDLKGIILDLRGNPGGLLNEAVNIVNIFVDKGQLVCSTKGKLPDKNNYHNTQITGLDLNIPLAILVDEGSASASEIVSGAIQDLDRGVIIGQKTYGKGLVQNIVPLTYNAEMKVTIAKYYIPSGRCIQELDYAHKDVEGHATKTPDSLTTAFKTKSGRVVYDRGGIEPDVYLKPKEYSNICISLLDKYLLFDFATLYYRTHTTIPSPGEFQITDEIYNDFITFLQGKVYDYETQSEKTLKEFRENAEKEKYFTAVGPEYEALQAKIMHNKGEDLVTYKNDIKYLLKTYIITRYYYQKGRIQATLSEDTEVQKAIEVLNNSATYKGILDGTIKIPSEK